MIVVSNASPLRYLVVIDAADVLHRLFGEVVIPPAVHAELSRQRTPETVRSWLARSPEWLRVQTPSISDPTLKLHVGEAQAILLAKELKADRLLIDDRKAMRAAHERGVATTRTPAVLALAAEHGLVDAQVMFERLKRTNIRVPPGLLDEFIKQLSRTKGAAPHPVVRKPTAEKRPGRHRDRGHDLGR